MTDFVFEDLFLDGAAKGAPAIPNVAATSVLIDGKVFVDESARVEDVFSPIRRMGKLTSPDFDDRIKIGSYAFCNEATALRAAQAAKDAYGNGKGKVGVVCVCVCMCAFRFQCVCVR